MSVYVTEQTSTGNLYFVCHAANIQTFLREKRVIEMVRGLGKQFLEREREKWCVCVCVRKKMGLREREN